MRSQAIDFLRVKAILVISLAAFLSGCATARIAEGPSVTALTIRKDLPTVEIGPVQDGRGNKTHSGTIGADAVSVPATVTKTLRNYLVSTIYDNFSVNIKMAEGSDPKPAAGATKHIGSKLESVSIFSIDSILQPVDTRCALSVVVHDQNGNKVFEKTYSGFYQERIGMAWDIDGTTGKLVEESIRDIARQIGSDQELKKLLEAQ